MLQTKVGVAIIFIWKMVWWWNWLKHTYFRLTYSCSKIFKNFRCRDQNLSYFRNARQYFVSYTIKQESCMPTYMPIYSQEKTSWKLNERLTVIETFSIKSADTFSHLKWLWRLFLRIPYKQNLIRGNLIKKENTTRQDTLNNFNRSYLKDSTMASSTFSNTFTSTKQCTTKTKIVHPMWKELLLMTCHLSRRACITTTFLKMLKNLHLSSHNTYLQKIKYKSVLGKWYIFCI